MTLVYIVMQSVGEWSDRTESTVEAWRDREKAKSRVLELSAETRERKIKMDELRRTYEDMDEAGQEEFLSTLSEEDDDDFWYYFIREVWLMD